MDLRQKVIEAATKSLSMFGYKGTTMDQVARLANVGKGTIYTFFESKEALFTYILNHLIDELKQTAEARIQQSAPFFENLERALHGILLYRRDHELFLKLIQEVREIGTPAVREGLVYVEQAVVAYISRHIQSGLAAGDVSPCNPDVVAFILLKTYTALVTDWEVYRPALTDAEIRESFHQVFALGLAT